MRCKIGQPALPFTTQDIHGHTITLQDYRGQWLLLSFLRFVTCPRCSLRLYSLSLHYPRFRELGLQVVAFVESPQALILQRPYAAEAPFPIIADPQERFYKAYGAKNSRFGLWWGGHWHREEIREAARQGFGQPDIIGNDYRMPADIIIDPQQIVRVAHYGRHSADMLTLANIEKSLPALAPLTATTP